MIKLPNLKNNRVVFLGIGNVTRGDDAFGPLLFDELKPYRRSTFLPLNGGELPENMTSIIKKFMPDYLIMADAALLEGQEAGLTLINEADISNPSLSTHTLPLNIMIKFIRQDLPDLKVIFIAANARHTDFGQDPSPEVSQAVKTAAIALIRAING